MARTELTGKQIKNQSVDLTEDVTGVLPVANGGTGSDTLALNNVLLGNGTGAPQTVAPGTSGNVLTSDGSTWVSSAPTGGGGAGDVTLDGAQTLTNKTISGTSNTLTDIPQSAVTDLGTALGAKQSTSEKGQTGGYASLDSSGKVPSSQLPITQAEWATLDGKPAVVAAGATEADARLAIHAEYTGNKGQANGYASLDSSGVVPVIQLPTGVVVDGVAVGSESFQLLSGSTPIGDPISILLGSVDGGSPTDVTAVHVDGGQLT